MDDDNRELVHRLFATVTAMLEEATEMAAAGQSSRTSPSQLAGLARRLDAAARDIATLAEAAVIVANLDVNLRPNRRKPSR